MRRAHCLAVAAALPLALVVGPAATSPARTQDLAASAPAEESGLARVSKVDGVLLQRESHKLGTISTSHGKDIECRALILKDLIGSGRAGSPAPVGGMVLKIEEKYGDKSLYIDQDEVEGLKAALLFLQEKGLAVVNESIAELGPGSRRSTEIHYTTRDGLTLGVFESKGKLVYALKIGRSADWALLSEDGSAQLLAKLERVGKALETL